MTCSPTQPEMVSETLRLPLRAVVASSSAIRSSRSAQQFPPRSAADALPAERPPISRPAATRALRLDFFIFSLPSSSQLMADAEQKERETRKPPSNAQCVSKGSLRARSDTAVIRGSATIRQCRIGPDESAGVATGPRDVSALTVRNACFLAAEKRAAPRICGTADIACTPVHYSCRLADAQHCSLPRERSTAIEHCGPTASPGRPRNTSDWG